MRMLLWGNLLLFSGELVNFLLRLFRGRTIMRMHRVHANGVDYPVHTDTAGQPLDCGDGVFPLKVHDQRALSPSHRKPVFVFIDCENASGPHQLRTGNGELPYWPAAKHGNCISGFHFGQLGAEPAGRKDIRNQDSLIVTYEPRRVCRRLFGLSDAAMTRSLAWA